MRKLYVLLVALCVGFVASAQLTGTKNIPGDYATVAAAVTDLNTQGVGSGGVNFVIADGYTETAPAGGFTISNPAGNGVGNTISFQRANTGGAKPLFTAFGGQTAGNLNDAVFKIVGTDYVVLTGLSIQENAANTTTVAGTNNMTEWGIALIYATATNGSQNVTVQDCSISLNRVYQNTFGIYSNSTHSATAVGTSVSATGVAGGNGGLKVYGNAISNVNLGIVVVGPTAAADLNTGIDIGGTTTATGNTITNFGTTGTFSTYANVSGTVNGILVRNSIGFTISNNTITSSVGGVTAGTLNGIQVPAATSTPTGTFTNGISNNIISLRSGAATGAINGINYPSGSASATSTVNINNNDFNTFGHTVTASGTIGFITIASTNQFTTINNNTFTNISVNTTGSVTFIAHGYTMPAGGTQTLSGNSIVTGFAKTGAGGTVTIATTGTSSPTGTVATYNNNNFSNITVTGATALTGFTNSDGATGSPAKIITNNSFTNWTGGSSPIIVVTVAYIGGPTSSISANTITGITGQLSITGITIGSSFSGANPLIISGNTINNLTSSGTGGAVTGIACSNTSAVVNVNGNFVNSLSSTGASVVNGINITGAVNTNIFKNKIYNLAGSNASSTVNGIAVSSGTLVTVHNNLIGDLRTPAANAANPLVGINVTGGTTVNLYFNTVNLAATSTGALFGSSAVSNSTTPTVTLANNIFVNTSTPNGAGFVSAYRRSTVTLTTYGSGSNNNLFYAGTPGTNNLIFYDGTNSDQTLAAFQTRVAPRDAASISEVPPFISTVGTDATFLHITPGASTGIESGGSNISGITDDYDGDVRAGNTGYTGSGSAPDIGADEFVGVATGTPCVAPTDQATALVLGTATLTTQPGSFTAAASSPSGYLVVRSVGAFTGTPANATSYNTGNVIGNGTVIQSGTSLTFTATGLSGNTEYTYTVLSFNNTACIGGPVYNTASPLTATATTCPATPGAISASNSTTTGFQINFNSSRGGGATTITYNLEVATDATFATPVAGSPFTFSDTTTVQNIMSYTVNGLSAATTYFVRLVANGCNTATVTGSGTTACNAVSVPYSEGFESITAANTLPACVTASPAVSSGGKTQTYIAAGVNSALVARTGTKYAAVYYLPNAAGYFFSAPLQLTGGVSYTASVYYRTDGIAWPLAGLKFGTTASIAGMTTTIASVTGANATTYTQITGAFTPATTGVYYVAFFADNTANNAPNYMAFDDFTVEVTPTTPCAAPADQATGLTLGTPAVTTQPGSFTAAASAPSGYLVVRSVGAFTGAPVDATTYNTGNALGNGVVVQSSAAVTFTATGLTGNTNYTYTVFAFNNTACIGGPVYNTMSPVSATSATCPATPASVTTVPTSSTIRFNFTSSKGGGFVTPVEYTLDVSTENMFTTGLVSGSPFIFSDTTTVQNIMSYTVSGLNPTTQYFYRIKSNGCNTAYSTISSATTLGVPPVNDDAVNAVTLTVDAGCIGAPYTLVNATQATAEPIGTCASTIGYATVWFKFVAPANGSVKVSTDLGTGNTLIDSRIALFSATDAANYNSFSIISCDEDGGSVAGNMSVLYATGLTPGVTYYVAVDKYQSSTTSGTFCIAVDALTSSMLSTTNNCTSAAQTPFGTVTSYSGWVPLLDGNSNLIALVRNPVGGAVNAYATPRQTVSATQRQNGTISYLNRNYLINNSTATNVQVQFFFLDTELASLTAADGTTLSTLGVTRQAGTTCRSDFATANGTSTFLPQTGNGSTGGVSWITVTTPAFSNFYLNKSGATLPASILTFSGSRQGNVNNLKWTVAQERDVQEYSIERSEDGRTWTTAGTVASLGNTSLQRGYTFADNNINGSKQYYRLRQVDVAGNAKLSTIVIINGTKATQLVLNGLFPNPASNKLSVLVAAPARDNITIVVMDAVGKVVKLQQAFVDAGSNTLELNLQGLASGSYLLKVTCATNCQTVTQKFVKE